jgi:hypothetical protein
MNSSKMDVISGCKKRFPQSVIPQKTYYRKELPESLISFTSKKGKELFMEALSNGEANIYFPLANNFSMQSEPAFCGLCSLSIVLNALSMDPGLTWKGIWRWYSEEMLECCEPLEIIRKNGITFSQLAATARCNGLQVVVKHADHTTFDEFIEDLKKVTRSDDIHMIVSFARSGLNQSGDGHFAPIGAFASDQNQVLIMETARFKYPSFFVDSKVLYDAMFPIDKVTGLSRGYMLLSNGNFIKLPLCKIVLHSPEWNYLTNLFWKILPCSLQSVKDCKIAIKNILEGIPFQYHFFTKVGVDGYDLADNVETRFEFTNSLNEQIKLLFSEIESHPIFTIISDIPFRTSGEKLTEGNSDLHILATLFLLTIPRDFIALIPPEIAREIFKLRSDQTMKELPLLREEVSRMAMQWSSMLNSNCECRNKAI